ncbi:MAG TPA: hypothetical protein VKV74_01960 [Bryobacteraceae bacterium]|nr:hypothetical protein [Bryobacteraceae bacterium]
MSRHLNQDELLHCLYGIGEREAHAHLLACEECAGRYAAYQRRRSEAAASIGVPSHFLAAQRRAVYARLTEPPRSQAKWAPALAAGLLFVLGLFLWPSAHLPQRPAPAAKPELTDEQLFSDVYSIEESMEPRAAAPIQMLFEPVPDLAEEGEN